MLGIGAYSNTSNIINNEVRAFKGLKNEIDLENKQLQSQAGEKADLDDLRNIGQEFAIKQGKDLLAKYGVDAYKGKIPFTKTSIQQLDKKAGKFIGGGIDKGLEMGKNAMNQIRGSIGKQAASMNFSERLNNGIDLPELDDKSIGDIPEIANQEKFSNILKQQGGNRITSIEELQEPTINVQQEAYELDPKFNYNTGSEGQSLEDVEKFKDDGVGIGEFEDHIKTKYGLGQEAAEEAARTTEKSVSSGVSDVVGETIKSATSDFVKTATTDVTDEIVTQGVAGALDATGILSPLGGLISLGADIFALFEAGKTADDFVEREITKTKPEPQAEKIPVPKQPLTLAQKGYGITPSLDTYDIAHTSIAQGW